MRLADMSRPAAISNARAEGSFCVQQTLLGDDRVTHAGAGREAWEPAPCTAPQPKCGAGPFRHSPVNELRQAAGPLAPLTAQLARIPAAFPSADTDADDEYVEMQVMQRWAWSEVEAAGKALGPAELLLLRAELLDAAAPTAAAAAAHAVDIEAQGGRRWEAIGEPTGEGPDPTEPLLPCALLSANGCEDAGMEHRNWQLWRVHGMPCKIAYIHCMHVK